MSRTPIDRLVRGCLIERWARLPVHEGSEFEGVKDIYWVSTEGHIAWCSYEVRPGKRFGLKRLRPDNKPGRRPKNKVNLKMPGRYRIKTARPYRLVLATFDTGEGLGCHEDDNGLDNRLENLSYGDHSQNLKDAYRNGVRRPTRKALLDDSDTPVYVPPSPEEEVPF